ncbi:P-loop containing nucleoside triphosphate hydrolase protein [Xylaria sp. FL0043]|nr:P-loop containing nucleoside triphosphate hydrolase protein [Xylaria sp. FL0043]
MAHNTPPTNALSLDDTLEVLKANPQTQDPKTLRPEDIGTRCDTKSLYEGPKKCDCCINWVEEYPSDTTKGQTEQESEVRRYAIVCRLQKAHENSEEPLELHSIIIQSPLLKSILGDIFIGYPGITTTLKELKFSKPLWNFFYGWKALTEARARYKPESNEYKLIRELLDTLTLHLGSVHDVAHDLIRNGVITYDYLWTLFAPDTPVLSQYRNRDCISEVKETRYYLGSPPFTENKYNVFCKYIEWDGDNFGWQTGHIKVPEFSGTKPIEELGVYPIIYHKAPEDIQSKLSERGRQFLSLGGCHHKAYNGVIEVSGESLLGSKSLRISERIVIDAQAFKQHTKQEEEGEPAFDPLHSDLSDHYAMLCSPVVKAYGLKTKCWGYVDVDGISDIKWDEDAFRNLVLENDTKRLIESFVLTQTRKEKGREFDDIIEGKGQGIIMLLTGEPGVGKTLTAETVAEKACRPLYMLSVGELGTSSDTVERGLTKAFDLAQRWDAVLLLDESDVFLEERTSDNLERNQLVSIFLRMLEYYRGIMFLTTNRLSAFDPAFQSRIHLTLHYNTLDQVSRRKIWQVLLKHARIEEFSEADLVALSKVAINGRQIKNAVKSANLLAASENAALNLTHVNTALRVMRSEEKPKASDNGLMSYMRWLARGFGKTS